MAAQRRLVLASCAVQAIRNLQSVQIEAAPRLNVISGDNGQGKTSLLEAIYLLATSKSFRTSRLTEVVHHEATVASVRGKWIETFASGPQLTRTQTFGIEGRRRHVTIDGERIKRLTDYATRSPVVVFEPRQLSMTTGPPTERRIMLDRLTLFTHPNVVEDRSRYSRALKERQRLLSECSSIRAVESELEVYERLLARHGAAITRARREATTKLQVAFQFAFEEIAAPGLLLEASYQAGGCDEEEAAAQHLFEDRSKDLRRKRTSFGPHQDDLYLQIDGHPARVVASQGQHRALTLALKAAELRCIAEAREVSPILLLDDVSSELDPERTRALFAYLAKTDSQIFLTTTRQNLIVSEELAGGERRDFHVVQGAIQSA